MPLSVSQLVALQTGAYVNDGFTAVVRSIEQKTAKPPKNTRFWVCKLGDTSNSAEVEMAVFTAPGFREGDRIDVTGRGIKFEASNYGPKVKIGQDTFFSVVGAAVRSEGQPVPHHLEKEDGFASAPSDFELQMKRIGFLYCHADYYARRSQDLCGNNWTADELQACRSSIFIEACRRNLIDIVPALKDVGAQPPRAASRAPVPEADVPF